MSTKTLRKRIALATVVALGAGVLSLVSTSTANAAGYGSSATAASTGGDINSISASTGLLSPDVTSGTTTTATATLLSSGTLTVAAAWGTGHNGYYVVSGGASISTAAASGIVPAADQKSVVITAASKSFNVTPTGAAGSTFTITGYDVTTNATVATAAAAATTAVSVLTVTIAASSVAGAPSVANSVVAWVNSTTTTSTGADVSTANTTTTGNKLSLYIKLYDAYGNAITSTSGALVVTASTGANSAIGTSQSGSGGTFATSVSSSSPSTPLYAIISEATAGAGWSGTVSVTYNGVLMATKSGTITGNVSKITVTPTAIAHRNSTAVAGAFKFQAYDSAGSAVVITASSLAVDTNSKPNVIAAVTGTDNNTTTASGWGSVTGGIENGSSDVVLKYTRSDGTVVKSNSFTLSNGGAAYAYTAKFDKSSYAPGDVATLTVSFVDSKGAPAATDSALYTVATSSPYVWDATITAPQLTLVGTTGTFSTGTEVSGASGTRVKTYPTVAEYTGALAGTETDAVVSPDTKGQVTFKYTVGSTAGNYNAVVTFPSIDSTGTTAGYQIASSGTQLNDVLKGIVDLIASINKQIAALAKLVVATKKK